MYLDKIPMCVFNESNIGPKKSFWNRFNPFGNKKNAASINPITTPANNTTNHSLTEDSKNIVLTDENMGIEYTLAECCHPIPGDEVMGFKDKNGIITVHKRDCEKAKMLKASQGQNIYTTTWDTHRINSFKEQFNIRGIDRFGVLNKVLSVMTTLFHINLYNISLHAENGIFFGEFGVYVYDKKELDNLFTSLKEISEIVSVKRIETNIS